MGAGAYALGVEHEHVALGGQQVDEQLHVVDQRRRERLHALDGHPLGELVGDLDELRVCLAELGRASAYVIGEQQLPAGRRPDALDRLQRALVRDGEARISSISSPKNSTRRGCSSVGGKTSTMPPRTANSPRFSTRSTREYAAPASRLTTSSSSTSCPRASSTGSRSARPLTCGCSTERTGATITLSGPLLASSPGCLIRRRTASRRPTVSLRGLSRSCGSVSHAGYSATDAGSSRSCSSSVRSSASRTVAATTSTVRPASTSPLTTNGRSAAGPVRSRFVTPCLASSIDAASAARAGPGRPGRRRTRAAPLCSETVVRARTMTPNRIGEGVNYPSESTWRIADHRTGRDRSNPRWSSSDEASGQTKPGPVPRHAQPEVVEQRARRAEQTRPRAVRRRVAATTGGRAASEASGQTRPGAQMAQPPSHTTAQQTFGEVPACLCPAGGWCGGVRGGAASGPADAPPDQRPGGDDRH